MIHVSCMYVHVLDDDHVCICICCKLQMHENNSRGVQMHTYIPGHLWSLKYSPSVLGRIYICMAHIALSAQCNYY